MANIKPVFIFWNLNSLQDEQMTQPEFGIFNFVIAESPVKVVFGMGDHVKLNYILYTNTLIFIPAPTDAIIRSRLCLFCEVLADLLI